MSAPKYINVNGVPQINPVWQRDNPGAYTMTTVADNQQALPIFSSVDNFMETNLRAPKPLLRVFETVQAPQYVESFGAGQNFEGVSFLDDLSSIFTQLEIPIGLMGHLIELRWFSLHFLIDDSGSMGSSSNLLRSMASPQMSGYSGSTYMTRWEEAQDRLHVLMDLLAYVPTQQIRLSFLNHPDIICLQRQGRSPLDFKNYAHFTISQVFQRVRPINGTPLYEKMQEMIRDAVRRGAPTMHYVITDGSPNGGARDIKMIERLLLNERGDPAQHPVTFLSCSNNPRDVEWMHESEECSPYVAALHDFIDERNEVLRDQGAAFPYSRGLWLLANICAARDPNGLDAMDQHAPLTKSILDNLLGRIHSESEYRQYFQLHPTYIGGQITFTAGYYHARQVFQEDYELFLNAQIEGEIPSVIFFKQRLATYLRSDMEAEDDNSEARDIVTVERELAYARQCNQFQRDNMELQQACNQRRDQAAYIYQQERIQVEPSAPPMPDDYGQSSAPAAFVYSPSDNYMYPSCPYDTQDNSVTMPQQINPMFASLPMTAPPPMHSGYLFKLGRRKTFGIFNSIKYRYVKLESTAKATKLTYYTSNTSTWPMGTVDLSKPGSTVRIQTQRIQRAHGMFGNEIIITAEGDRGGVPLIVFDRRVDTTNIYQWLTALQLHTQYAISVAASGAGGRAF